MPKKLQYSNEALQKALNAMKAGESASKVAKKYGVPKSTLNDKFSGRQPKEKYAGTPVLSKAEESRLAQWIVKRAESGNPVVKSEIQDIVSILVKNKNVQTPFANNLPGRYWFKGFLRRNPEVSVGMVRIVHNSSERRAKITKKDLECFDFIEVFN